MGYFRDDDMAFLRLQDTQREDENRRIVAAGGPSFVSWPVRLMQTAAKRLQGASGSRPAPRPALRRRPAPRG